jgi:hypothetical protein
MFTKLSTTRQSAAQRDVDHVLIDLGQSFADAKWLDDESRRDVLKLLFAIQERLLLAASSQPHGHKRKRIPSFEEALEDEVDLNSSDDDGDYEQQQRDDHKSTTQWFDKQGKSTTPQSSTYITCNTAQCVLYVGCHVMVTYADELDEHSTPHMAPGVVTELSPDGRDNVYGLHWYASDRELGSDDNYGQLQLDVTSKGVCLSISDDGVMPYDVPGIVPLQYLTRVDSTKQSDDYSRGLADFFTYMARQVREHVHDPILERLELQYVALDYLLKTLAGKRFTKRNVGLFTFGETERTDLLQVIVDKVCDGHDKILTDEATTTVTCSACRLVRNCSMRMVGGHYLGSTCGAKLQRLVDNTVKLLECRQ